MRKPRLFFVVIIILTLFAAYVVLPPLSIPFGAKSLRIPGGLHFQFGQNVVNKDFPFQKGLDRKSVV